MLRDPILTGFLRGKEMDKMAECTQNVLLDGCGIWQEKGHLHVQRISVLNALGRHTQIHPQASRTSGLNFRSLPEQLGQEEPVPRAPSGEAAIAYRDPMWTLVGVSDGQAPIPHYLFLLIREHARPGIERLINGFDCARKQLRQQLAWHRLALRQQAIERDR